MRLPDSLMRRLARQLGRPSGVVGRLAVARMLNRGNQATVTAAVDALELRRGEVAADIGFGGGLGLTLLLDRLGMAGRVHGVDLSPAMLRRAASRFRRERRRLTLHLGSVTELPLDDASIDAAICVNTVYFVADLEKAFAELARVLKPAGRLVLGAGDPDMMAAMPITRHGFRVRPIEELTAGLAEAGLPVTEHRRVGSGDRAFHLLVARRQ
jgi:arsenite methyltransferase